MQEEGDYMVNHSKSTLPHLNDPLLLYCASCGRTAQIWDQGKDFFITALFSVLGSLTLWCLCAPFCYLQRYRKQVVIWSKIGAFLFTILNKLCGHWSRGEPGKMCKTQTHVESLAKAKEKSISTDHRLINRCCGLETPCSSVCNGTQTGSDAHATPARTKTSQSHENS